jgi:hypothetical protein
LVHHKDQRGPDPINAASFIARHLDIGPYVEEYMASHESKCQRRCVNELNAVHVHVDLGDEPLLCGSSELKCGISFPLYFPTGNTAYWSAYFNSEGEARAFARSILGSDRRGGRT